MSKESLQSLGKVWQYELDVFPLNHPPLYAKCYKAMFILNECIYDHV